MYYTDITNKELQAFHPVQAHNFTVSLTQILTSPLFKVETIGDLYRIVPLFYTGRITSSNPQDKILDDKLILATQTSDETYYTFISNDESEIVDYREYGEYYEIGDTLTTSEFNAIISLLRQNTIHTDTIRINPVINGVYGVYDFDIEDCSFLDNGILISDETISAEPKVRLSNNLFNYSTYTLKLRVLHYSDVNILDDEPASDFKVIETLEIELTPDTWVDIPVTDLEENYIILFDANVEITHDQPVIILPTTLEVTSDKDVIQTGDNATITATLYDQKDLPISDESVTFTFLHGETTVETQTAVTDKDGVCSVSYTGKGAGLLNIQVSTGMLQSITYVTDTVFYDDGVTDEGYKKFYNYAAFNPQVQSDGTLLTNSAASTANYFANLDSTSDLYDFTAPFCVEFDLVSYQATYAGVQIAERGASGVIKNFSQLGISGSCHLKVTVDGTQLSYQVGDETPVTQNYTVTKGRVSLTLNNGTLKYKNFLIYPV